MIDEAELFGTPGQTALMRRGAAARILLGDNPRFSWYGRMTALGDPGGDTAEVLAALARLQGAGVCYFYPEDRAERLFADLAARGFATDRHEHFMGSDTALSAARAALKDAPLPPDLTLAAVGRDTPREVLVAIAELCCECGVMPVPGSVMRGVALDGICLFATDPSGGIAATASCLRMHHPASRWARVAMWGLLATRPDRRGQRIALHLGARAMLHMHDRHGMRAFMTGVKADNASSSAICHRLGVSATGMIYAQCLDETLLGGSSITR